MGKRMIQVIPLLKRHWKKKSRRLVANANYSGRSLCNNEFRCRCRKNTLKCGLFCGSGSLPCSRDSHFRLVRSSSNRAWCADVSWFKNEYQSHYWIPKMFRRTHPRKCSNEAALLQLPLDSGTKTKTMRWPWSAQCLRRVTSGVSSSGYGRRSYHARSCCWRIAD